MEKVVLVVDDSATVRKFVAAALNMKGFRVITASDGIEALERMPSEKFDLIITDLNMPDMDGYELIRSIRETPEYRDIPIIVLSSMTDLKNKDLAMESGALAFLEKPLSTEVIQREVFKFLNKTGMGTI
ncbi:MAG: response regulator [Bacteroidetes bacterium]|nr:response regulator [Bacteroidota bacterium]